jgi:putative oxidoreductase
MNDWKYYIIECTLRVFLGILFFSQGFDKVFHVKMHDVAEIFGAEMAKRKIPPMVLSLSAYFTSFTELICGFLLIIGLFKYYALTLLGVDMLIVATAFSMIQPLWDMQFVFPRLLLLTILFIFPNDWEKLSIDYFTQHFQIK